MTYKLFFNCTARQEGKTLALEQVKKALPASEPPKHTGPNAWAYRVFDIVRAFDKSSDKIKGISFGLDRTIDKHDCVVSVGFSVHYDHPDTDPWLSASGRFDKVEVQNLRMSIDEYVIHVFEEMRHNLDDHIRSVGMRSITNIVREEMGWPLEEWYARILSGFRYVIEPMGMKYDIRHLKETKNINDYVQVRLGTIEKNVQHVVLEEEVVQLSFEELMDYVNDTVCRMYKELNDG